MSKLLKEKILEDLKQNAPDIMTSSGYPSHIEHDGVVSDKVDPTAMTAAFTVVKRRKKPNRNGHTVQIKETDEAGGILLDNYKKNPVVMFDHGQTGYPIPIAVSEVNNELAFRRLVTKAEATATFSQVLPEAELIFALIDEGILRASSISFMPLLARRNKINPDKRANKDDNGIIDTGSPFYSFDFLENDLLEWSVVGIPADPDAIRKMLDRGGINDAKVTDSLRPAFQNMGGEKPAWTMGWRETDSGLSLPDAIVEIKDSLDMLADTVGELIESSRSDNGGIKIDMPDMNEDDFTELMDALRERRVFSRLESDEPEDEPDDEPDSEDDSAEESDETVEDSLDLEALADRCLKITNDKLKEQEAESALRLDALESRLLQAMGKDSSE